MKNITLTRIGGAAAALVVAATMSACSAGGQSVADACKIAQQEISKASSSASSDLNSSLQQAAQGDKVDFAALFQPVLDGLSSAEKKVTNEKVKEPLTAFADEYKSFVKVFDGFEMPDLKNLDASDPNAMQKVEEAQTKAQEITTKSQAAMTKLTDESKKLQAVCTAG
ncbi:hypothetical protein [uncultured Microbacterium sp.]|uniref:hypothetical protein n=1 Tax=uncultured Microbacterium sp. TaxID=191216 RepID=UPI0025FBE607|nr:hypothetical protein [uncultured Microbacterium sp.]